MPYTHFRFIAYEIPTVTSPTGNKPFISGWDAGNLSPAVVRAPVPASVKDDDAIKRLRRLASAVDYANLRLPVMLDDNANTLKIFVVPEFYFRPPVISASYKHNTYPSTSASQILEALSSMFTNAAYKDWLIVCGTLMWNTGEDSKGRLLCFNTAPYVQGNVAQKDSLGVVQKNLPSGIDGVPVATAANYDPNVGNYYASLKVRKSHVFTIDNVQVGLEVCLDHLDSATCRVLRRTLVEWDTQPTPIIKLHILTAGGMGIKTQSVCAKTGGYIMRNDGIYGTTARSELKQITGYEEDTGPNTGMQDIGDAYMDRDSFAKLGASIDSEWSADLPNTIPIPVGNLSFTQRVVFYPVQAIPA